LSILALEFEYNEECNMLRRVRLYNYNTNYYDDLACGREKKTILSIIKRHEKENTKQEEGEFTKLILSYWLLMTHSSGSINFEL
jgi:hypothetical protein